MGIVGNHGDDKFKELRMSYNDLFDLSYLPDCGYSVITIEGNPFDMDENMDLINGINARVKIYKTK